MREDLINRWMLQWIYRFRYVPDVGYTDNSFIQSGPHAILTEAEYSTRNAIDDVSYLSGEELREIHIRLGRGTELCQRTADPFYSKGKKCEKI